MKKPTLIGVRIDNETRSRADLRKSGVHRYAQDPDFQILIISYAPIVRLPDGSAVTGKPRVLGQDGPNRKKFERIITDPRFEKHAFNAEFERVTLSAWLGMDTGEYIDPENWHCSAIRANANGVFGSLAEVGRALKSPIQKDPEGAALIKLFSVPDRKTGVFNEPEDYAPQFEKFEAYCNRDVATEHAIAALLPGIPEDVQRQYEADQRINDRGSSHDRRLSEQAGAQVTTEQGRLMDVLRRLTNVDNPNSVQQMRGWLDTQGWPMTSLAKDARAAAIADPDVPPIVAKALDLKGRASLSSVSKHKAALNTRCTDGRIRGSLQFHGAHTGREAGRGIQPQNLPRAEASSADRALLRSGRAGRRAPEIAKGSVRASLIPASGHRFVVFDYNAIEARVLGWLANELWVMEEFTTGEGKIYEANAEKMFGANKADLLASLRACGKCGTCEACELRSKAKVSNLALGYYGGAGALVAMGAESSGIDCGNYIELNLMWVLAGSPGKFHEWKPELHDYPELLRLRDLYRASSPATVSFWKQMAAMWDTAALQGKATAFGPENRATMMRDGRHNRLVLPSGRSIWYRDATAAYGGGKRPRVETRMYTGKSKGVGHTRVHAYGGSLTENITQAVARDVMFDLIMRVEEKTKAGWPGRIVLHVHDELVLEVPDKHTGLVMADLGTMMQQAPDWAPGLPLKGEGQVMERYGK